MTASKVSLKLLIDRTGRRVLFAEAGKDFVDFLFTLLTLPIGTAIKLLDNKPMVGCFGNLYQSVTDLSDDYMQPGQLKDVVLKPKSSILPISNQVPLLPLPPQEWSIPTTPTTATQFYTCGRLCTNAVFSPVSRNCSNCGNRMSSVVTHHVPMTTPAPTKLGEDGFVKGLVTYMIMDDLVVVPMSTISSIILLNKFNIKELSALEEKVVHVGLDEGLELLKHALGSKTALTNVFLSIKDENIIEV